MDDESWHAGEAHAPKSTGFVGGAKNRPAPISEAEVMKIVHQMQEGIEKPRPDSVEREMAAGSDVVMHIAGVVNVPNRAAFETGNATATGHVVDAARGAGALRFVHVSSLAAREPGLSDYGWSKERAEIIVRDSGLDWTIVRPPAVFGPGDTEMLDLFRMARRGIALLPPKGRMSAIYVDDLARLLVTLAADRTASIGAVYEPDDGQQGGWSHRGFARAIGRAVGRSHMATLAMPATLLKAGGRIDGLVRRSRAKLTPDRARYIAHPDWVAAAGAHPPADLWRPAIATDAALAETVR